MIEGALIIAAFVALLLAPLWGPWFMRNGKRGTTGGRRMM